MGRCALHEGGVLAADGLGDAWPAVARRPLHALATEAERRQSLEDYAEIKVAMDDAEDPGAALGAVKLTIGQWLRMERRWDAVVRSDPAVAERLEQRLAELRSRASRAAPDPA